MLCRNSSCEAAVGRALGQLLVHRNIMKHDVRFCHVVTDFGRSAWEVVEGFAVKSAVVLAMEMETGSGGTTGSRRRSSSGGGGRTSIVVREHFFH